ncbi:hypothetical protein [Actinomadura oligospora]|uniref:hypothetical protein n=1 Tax=Actinomadura oligospora TaxID=111804 RepID=UPI0004B88F57|nr:hypothetical protein [Actinomadura oligospora]
MTDPGRGWTVFCQEEAAADLHAMPRVLFEDVLRYFVRFAAEAGDAVDLGAPPPGSPLDGTGLRFELCVPGHQVIVEYLVVHDIREFRVTAVLWLG